MRYLLPFLMVFLLVSCNKSIYKITGKLSDDSFNGQTLYLTEYSQGKSNPFDSTVVNNNAFTFDGKVERPIFVQLGAGGGRALMALFVENANIEMNIDFVDGNKTTVTGSMLNDLQVSYKNGLAGIIEKSKEMVRYSKTKEMTDEFKAELAEMQKQIAVEYDAYNENFIDNNPGTLFTAYLLATLGNGMPVEYVQKTFDNLDDYVKNSGLGATVEKMLATRNTPDVEIGQKFRDLTMRTPDGKNMSISDYAGKGKYVLLDFWASWCGPCRRENPNVVAMYEKFKDKGFEIVGISLDEDKDKWLKGIADDKITWPQMSDLKAWESAATTKYKIKGIPFTVLLDKEGNIVDINLRGEELENKLKEIFPG